jgi:hypothetical protein
MQMMKCVYFTTSGNPGFFSVHRIVIISFFLFSPRAQVIPPSGNTTFDVVFLGREEGPVENTLYIHTSAGSFRFVVKADGTPNPYRLKPLVGVKMPINSSYSPLIEMHNPHNEPIQVIIHLCAYLLILFHVTSVRRFSCNMMHVLIVIGLFSKVSSTGVKQTLFCILIVKRRNTVKKTLFCILNILRRNTVFGMTKKLASLP